MNNEKQHMNLSGVDKQSQAFFKDGEFLWEKSQDAVWANMEALIDSKTKPKSKTINLRFVSYAIAASLLLFIGLGAFMRFYSVTITTPAAVHQLATLPDGSTVDLNAESQIKYNPYWWRFKREIKFDGEAYFQVEKGEKFTVISSNGTTEVLGTSFNVFSRDQIYKVTCLTGSVKVTSPALKSVILKPNTKAVIKANGSIKVEKNIDTVPEISWKDNLFMFTASPLQEVFYEIERQFDVKIKTNTDNYSLYSGNFSKNLDVEEVLSYVCPALGLEYIRKSEKEFIIVEESE